MRQPNMTRPIRHNHRDYHSSHRRQRHHQPRVAALTALGGPPIVGASLGSGLLGGLCYIAAAVSMAATLGAAGFITGLMQR